MTTTPAKSAAKSILDAHINQLIDLSTAIHSHPELSFQETHAAQLSANFLRDAGFRVSKGICDLPTAFVAEIGSGPLVVALCAEYDALPEVGHACGHNIIAATALGAGLALAEIADDLGLTVRVVGTPAEEGGGGKILLLERGGFAGVHAAMMVHPWPNDRLTASCLAVSHFDICFTGAQAHASASPWEGRNALDAMTIAQVAVGLARQQLEPGDQVHGVILEGGMAANVIPGSTTARYMCRSKTIQGLRKLYPKIKKCFEAGALAANVDVAFNQLCPDYSHMESDVGLLNFYRLNAEALGREFTLDDKGIDPPTLSTDMANVSLTIPSIHPLIGIEANGASNHQSAFASASVGTSANRAIYDGALGMAWTAIDAALDTNLRERLLANDH